MSSTPKRTPGAIDRKPKTIYQLDSPFTKVLWPEISPQNQETILELLCSILSPIGQHRSNHVMPSKGKRSKRRRREDEKQTAKSGGSEIPSMPPTPEISSFVVVGLNSITRSLEELSRKSKPATTPRSPERPQPQSKVQVNPDINRSNPMTEDLAALENPIDPPPKTPTAQHFAAIFTPNSTQPPVLHAHLPQLITTAARAHPSLPATRLVQLPRGCDARLCDALGLQRVSFIGILEGAPHSKALVELVREKVAEIDVPWLREVGEGRYLRVMVNAVKTSAPVVEKEKKVP